MHFLPNSQSKSFVLLRLRFKKGKHTVIHLKSNHVDAPTTPPPHVYIVRALIVFLQKKL